MRSVLRPALWLVAACGGASTPIANHSPPDPNQCPRGERLNALAQRAWNVTDRDVTPTCTALRAGEPLWIIDGDLPRTEDELLSFAYHVAVVTPDGRVRSLEVEPEQPPDEGNRTHWTYLPIDLDRDGHDEVLVDSFLSHACCGPQGRLGVAKVVDGKLAGRTEAQLPYWSSNQNGIADPSEYRECKGTYEIVKDRDGRPLLEITGPPDTGVEECPLPGPHRYRWTGDDLVEVR